MVDLITLEDLNTVAFNNQEFWWHKIDLTNLHAIGTDFSDVRVDFCKIKKRTEGNNIYYTVTVDNSLFTGRYYILVDGQNQMAASEDSKTFIFMLQSSQQTVEIYLYMGNLKIQTEAGMSARFLLETEVLSLNLKQLANVRSVPVIDFDTGMEYNVEVRLKQGYNLIRLNSFDCGYLLVKLLKTDLKFDCNQDLVVGEVNTVRLGADVDYLPDGALVGEYTPKITVNYAGKTIPVRYDKALKDYVFDLDLSDKPAESTIRFTVNVETNKVLNHTETEIALKSKFAEINTSDELQKLLNVGGVARLGKNIVLYEPITVKEDTLIIGNGKRLNFNNHQLIVPSDTMLKIQNLNIVNGVNSIRQESGSNVEISNTNFSNCKGFGSVIDCQIDTANLESENDFKTTLDTCSFEKCEMIVLHGGDLTVNNCIIMGSLFDKHYPYFLYQTDGNAILTNNAFELKSDTKIDEDIEFNTCIFTCGETATINGLSHEELQKNDVVNFLDVQKNTSDLNITYFYPLVDGYVNLNSSNGFCHAVSGLDYVFKTKVKLTKED